jgi:hypothetical protein
MIMAWRHIAGISIVLFICSLLSGLCGYLFITIVQLPHAWPHLRCAASRRLDGALFLPFRAVGFCHTALDQPARSSIALNQSVNLRFAVIWSVFTLILICGRFILLSWFEELRRNQQNQRLILRLDALAHLDA